MLDSALPWHNGQYAVSHLLDQSVSTHGCFARFAVQIKLFRQICDHFLMKSDVDKIVDHSSYDEGQSVSPFIQSARARPCVEPCSVLAPPSRCSLSCHPAALLVNAIACC